MFAENGVADGCIKTPLKMVSVFSPCRMTTILEILEILEILKILEILEPGAAMEESVPEFRLRTQVHKDILDTGDC